MEYHVTSKQFLQKDKKILNHSFKIILCFKFQFINTFNVVSVIQKIGNSAIFIGNGNG